MDLETSHSESSNIREELQRELDAVREKLETEVGTIRKEKEDLEEEKKKLDTTLEELEGRVKDAEQKLQVQEVGSQQLPVKQGHYIKILACCKYNFVDLN